MRRGGAGGAPKEFSTKHDFSTFGQFFTNLNAHPQRDTVSGVLSGAQKQDQINKLYMLARLRADQAKLNEAKEKMLKKKEHEEEKLNYEKLLSSEPRQISPGTEASFIENCPFTPPGSEAIFPAQHFAGGSHKKKKKKKKRRRSSEKKKGSASKRKKYYTDDLPDAPEYGFDFDADKILAKIQRKMELHKPRSDGKSPKEEVDSTDHVEEEFRQEQKDILQRKELDMLTDNKRFIPPHLRDVVNPFLLGEAVPSIEIDRLPKPGVDIPIAKAVKSIEKPVPAVLKGPAPPPPTRPPPGNTGTVGSPLRMIDRQRIRHAMKVSKNFKQILKLEGVMTGGVVPAGFDNLLSTAEA